MIDHKLRERGLHKNAELRPVHDGDRIDIGPFDCEFLPVTHSIPSGNITAFHNSQGVILHSSDFKLDLTPVDGRRTDLSRIGALAHDPGIRLLLADSTNADSRALPAPRRRSVVTGLVNSRPGGSSGHRGVVRQSYPSASAARRCRGRERSGVGHARALDAPQRQAGPRRRHPADPRLGTARHRRPRRSRSRADPDRVHRVAGRASAALTQMAIGQSKWLKLDDNDTVVFSSHPIPGNEAAVASVRNGLARYGVRVFHSGWSTSTPRDTASNRN